jgi:hypothetical protein
MKVQELLEAKKPARDYSPLGQLKELPQPIGINGGAYTYWVDVTKTPLKFTASDGSVIDKAKTLEDIAKWMDKWAAQLWLEFLRDEEGIDALKAENIIRTKKGRTDQQDHEANMRESAPTQKVKHPFEGGKKTTTITKKHKPLIWENMLGTVVARDFNDKLGKKEPKYFDYKWDDAREYAGVDKCSDLRICKAPQTYQNWPRKGQVALWGIPPEKQE